MKQRFVLSVSAKFSLALALLGMAGSSAVAAEIRFLSAVALKPVMDTLIPDFEKSSGHKVTIGYGTVGALTERVQKGEPADVAIVAGPQIDSLQTQGKVVVGSRANIAKVGVGAVVRKGAPKPDISDVEPFKRAMLAAKSILYPDPAGGGPPGIWMSGLLDRLGIGAEMKEKKQSWPIPVRISMTVLQAETSKSGSTKSAKISLRRTLIRSAHCHPQSKTTRSLPRVLALPASK
jgi:molybdate transport system substrate-binding protein